MRPSLKPRLVRVRGPSRRLVSRGGVGRRLAAGLALVVAIAVVIAIVLVVQSPSPTSGATDHSPASGATTVERRNLVETDTESGTLSYANPQTVYNRLTGTITWLPSVGQVIKPGQALYRINGEPVILMTGATPAYRDLSAADSSGPDILELNRNLLALGFNPEGIVADDVWQPATTAAVEVFQESLGEAPTAVISLGQIAFLPGDQVVSAVEAALGSDGGGLGGTPGSSATDTRPANRSEFVSLTTTTKPTRSRAKPKFTGKAKRTPTLAALLALLKAEAAQLKAETAELKAQHASARGGGQGGGTGNKHGARTGGSGAPSAAGSGGGSPSGGAGGSGGGGAATAILQASSTRVIATVDLDASKQSEAKVGERVTVEMPAGNTVNGKITAVSPVAQSSNSSGSGNSGGNNGGGGTGGGPGSGNGSSTATIPVTIALSGHVSGTGLDQVAVSVNFDQAEANNVLSVPVTALLATAGGGYAVQKAASPHRLVPVTTGLFAAGYVEISGPGVYPGLQVTDSQG